MRQLLRRPTFVSALLLMAGLTTLGGCRHAPKPATPWQPVAMKKAPPSLVLMQAPADGAGVIEALHDALAQLEGRKPAARMLLSVAISWDDATLQASAGARRVAISSIYATVQAGVIGEQFKQIRGLVDRMVKHAGKTAETRFALAYLRWILVSDGAGTLARRGLGDGVLKDLRSNLSALVTEHPTFDGPGDFDRHRIRRELASVTALMAQKSKAVAAPTPATPTAQRP